MQCTFSIVYEGPFWVGVLERRDGGDYWVARHVFGGEPSEAEVRRFLSEDLAFLSLTKVPLPGTVADEDGAREARLPNAKRAIRQARREQSRGLDSYTHVAWQAVRRDSIQKGRAEARSREEEATERQRLLKVEKKRQKHRGH